MSKIISFHIDETLIQGKITHYDPYDITVEILEPFTGFTTGCHIPYFARAHTDYRGKKGHQKAVELLSELYSALVLVKKKEKHLWSEMSKAGGLLEEVQKVRDQQSELTRQKQKLRDSFKSRQISQQEYQLQLKQNRKLYFELDMVIENSQSQFIEQQVPSIQGILKQNHLIQYLAKAESNVQ